MYWRLDLNISGTGFLPTIITGMTIHIISRSHPRVVTAIDSCWQNNCTPELAPPPAGTFMMPIRLFYADLDIQADNIDVLPYEGNHFPFIVTESDLEAYGLTVSATKAGCKFVVYVNWAQGRRSGQERIDDNGQPFSAVPDMIAHNYCYDNGRPRGHADVTDQRAVSRVCYALPPKKNIDLKLV
jgi:hypothetical protein